MNNSTISLRRSPKRETLYRLKANTWKPETFSTDSGDTSSRSQWWSKISRRMGTTSWRKTCPEVKWTRFASWSSQVAPIILRISKSTSKITMSRTGFSSINLCQISPPNWKSPSSRIKIIATSIASSPTRTAYWQEETIIKAPTIPFLEKESFLWKIPSHLCPMINFSPMTNLPKTMKK